MTRHQAIQPHRRGQHQAHENGFATKLVFLGMKHSEAAVHFTFYDLGSQYVQRNKKGKEVVIYYFALEVKLLMRPK